MYDTIADITTACKEWQSILLLTDWEVVCIFVEKDSIPGMAQIEYVRAKKQALLKLLREGDYINENFPHDQEKSLVHELLHLHFAWTDAFTSKPKDSELYLQMEVAIDSVARALVRTKQKNSC